PNVRVVAPDGSHAAERPAPAAAPDRREAAEPGVAAADRRPARPPAGLGQPALPRPLHPAGRRRPRRRVRLGLRQHPRPHTALGTARFLASYREPSRAAAAKAAAGDGFRVVAVELASGAVPLAEAPLEGDICLAIGNEDHGCSPALLAAVGAVAYIPQTGRVGSLNVAVAAAIAMAETRRREWHPNT